MIPWYLLYLCGQVGSGIDRNTLGVAAHDRSQSIGPIQRTTQIDDAAGAGAGGNAGVGADADGATVSSQDLKHWLLMSHALQILGCSTPSMVVGDCMAISDVLVKTSQEQDGNQGAPTLLTAARTFGVRGGRSSSNANARRCRRRATRTATTAIGSGSAARISVKHG